MKPKSAARTATFLTGPPVSQPISFGGLIVTQATPTSFSPNASSSDQVWRCRHRSHVPSLCCRWRGNL